MTQKLIGNYRVTHKIGEGGMGVVYAAEHATLGRQAAIKLLLPEHLGDELLATRFINEAKAAAAIRHPGIVEVFDFGRHEGGGLFIAMELLVGEDLEQRKKRGAVIPFEQAILFTMQACGVLDAAHRVGITHRDLKPSNIFVVSDPQVPGGERVKLLDFGIAKFAVSGDSGVAMTRAGAIMGTPTYMSPEQCLDSSKVDHRSDIYSLGCILYQMLCDRQPFAANNVFDIMTMQMHDMPQPPSEVVPTLPKELDRVIERAMAKERDERYQSAGEFAMALQSATGKRLDAGWLDASLGVHTDTTTLRGASGSVRAGARGGSRWVIPFTALVTVALGLGGFYLMRGGGEETNSRTEATTVDAGGPTWPIPPAPPTFVQLTSDDLSSLAPAGDNETLWIIRSEPPGAEVRYGDKPIGHTARPLAVRWQAQPARTERLTLHYDEYMTYYHDWNTAESFTEQIALKPQVTIQLTTKPKGAQVYTVAKPREDVEAYLDGELDYQGNTNMELHHAEGESLTIVLKRNGKKSVQREIFFDKDRVENVHLKKLVTVFIQTLPKGAEVWLGDRLITQPEDGIRLAAKKGRRVFVVKHPGCKDKKVYLQGRSDDSKLVELSCPDLE